MQENPAEIGMVGQSDISDMHLLFLYHFTHNIGLFALSFYD